MFPTSSLRPTRAGFGVICCSLLAASAACAQTTSYKLSFSPGKAPAGYTQVAPTAVYSKETGYGFEPGETIKVENRGGDDPLHGGFCTSDKPFHFSVAVPEGNYNVTVTLGDKTDESNTTVKAELRRLMLENVQTAPGKFETRTFTVNVRQPQISGGSGGVKLKGRETTSEAWAWDDRLTLEFNGKKPCLDALEITKNDSAPTLYVLGDSTVCDQPGEAYASWGQMLPRFFKPGMAVANHAESGESLKSSWGARRLEKVLSVIKPGEYVFIQYGHNDEKEKGEGVGAMTTYKSDLKKWVAAIREHKGLPVLITPMNRRQFDADGKSRNAHGEYPEAVRQAAQEENVPLIDLHAMSLPFYESMGPEKSKLAFKEGDGTHHNNYGAYELAKCIVEGIRKNKLDVVKFLADGLPEFDPAHPDPLESFGLPTSAPSEAAGEKPYGS